MVRIFYTLVLFTTTQFCMCKSGSDTFRKWFIEHEENLYNDFNRALVTNKVQLAATAPENGDKMCIQTPLDFLSSDYWMSEFNRKVKNYDERLIVKFWYDQCDTPHARIEISTGYKPSLVESLDQILKDIPPPK